MSKYSFKAGIFDMDGVITKTAIVHAQAWKLVFDEYLRLLEKRDNKPFQEFTHQDYLNYVDGKPRLKGIASFLQSRGIELPVGTADDKFEDETVYAIGNTKNEKFRRVLDHDGVQLYDPTVKLIKQLKDNEIKVAVVSSSKNCKFVLEAADVLELFDTRIGGIIAQELGLKGKPEGDIFVRAAVDLGTSPGESIVFEDAISGVQSGRNGGFGLVVGIARSDNIHELIENGADIVVTSSAELDLDRMEKWFRKKPVKIGRGLQEKQTTKIFAQIPGHLEINPVYLDPFDRIYHQTKQKVLFISDRYSGQAKIKAVLKKLSAAMTVVIYGNSQCKDLAESSALERVYYLGNDGFIIYGESRPLALIEERESAEDSGQKVRWFMKAGQISWDKTQAIYIGSGPRAENAFRVVNTRGISVLVSDKEIISSAQFRISSAEELELLLEKLRS